jgi:hypothetical protein
MVGRRRTTGTSSPARKRPGGRRYTAGEWFMVLLGAALVILFAGIVITAILG